MSEESQPDDTKDQHSIDGVGQEHDESERGRPSNPKWWRPPIPPETYKWEEVRRQRQKGGYPWTHLDKDEEIDADDYLDENLYEPVNPPPLYGNESYLSKDLQQVPQTVEPPIEIPPEIDIITSEGLDGLDKPDPHDAGFDGDREWQNVPSEDEHSSSAKSKLKEKSGEPRSSTPKSVGFSPETITHESPEEPEDQEVPAQEMETEEGAEQSTSKGHVHHGKRQTAFDILKSKAADAAEHVKEKIKLAIPVRPRLKKRRKLKQSPDEDNEQEVPEDVEMKDAEDAPDAAEKEEQVEGAESSAALPSEEDAGEDDKDKEEKPENEGSDKLSKQEAEEEKKKKKAEEKLQQQKEKEEKEKKKAEEKLAKQKAAEEAKKAKLEEKLAKAREAEEQRQAKAEEEKRKQLEKEEAARKAAEAKKEEDARKAAEKAAKEEEARKAAEAKKAEEEARKAAEKAKMEEEEARKAAEKAKKEEEAKKALEAKKAEQEAKKAADKAKAEEERARKAAEKAQMEEEKRIAAEKAKQEEDERKAREVEEAASKSAETGEQTMDTSAATEETQGQGEEENVEEGEAMEVTQPTTPSGTTKRRYIRHRRQLPEIPNPITALRNQVEDFKSRLKRSRTPPRRHVQRKQRRSRSADASRSPPRDPEEGSEKADEEQEGTVEETENKQEESPAEVTAVVSEEQNSAPEKASEEVQQSSSASVSEAKEEPENEESVSTEKRPSETSTTTSGTITRRRQPAAKEKLDKIGAQLKSIGAKSLDIASQASKGVGKTMKVVGKDLQKLGSKAMEEIKSKQEPAKNEPQAPEPVEVVEDILPPQEEIAPPKRTFRFRRRGQSQEEADEEMEREDQEHLYENANEANDQANDPFSKNRLLGAGARDWESPHERAQSRDVSEEPYSGNASARDSPPGSSLASSTFAQVRRTGVLEEIDSDEFFLRERGISEGEDEEEVNRFLVEELRQAFRPSMSNALAGFDIEPPHVTPPPRPERAPRKPPRKDKENTSLPSYQTFPPERPKRKQPQGYVSKFMKEHGGEDEDMGSNEEVRGSLDDMREEEFEGDEALQIVKDKLSELDRDMDEEAPPREVSQPTSALDDYEDDGRYEPINDGPVKPQRTKRKKPRRPPTPPSFYYNTIAANEWHREMEEHIQVDEPTAPTRKRRESGKSASLPPVSGEEEKDSRQEEDKPEIEGTPAEGMTFTLSFPVNVMEGRVTTGTSEAGTDDTGDYVDEAGYAIVQKDREVPRTIPRKKKKRTKLDGQEQPDQTGTFFSLPRSSPRTTQVEPPARPNRTYSTLKPRRPPRSKSGSRQNLNNRSPVPARRDGDENRPSTAIGIMQGRPLPPPPRPQRSPAPYNELDQSSIERSVGLRHYANFDEIESRTLEEDLASATRVIEVDRACQTDPVPEDEFIVGLSATESPLLDSSRIRTASPRLEEAHQGILRTPSPAPATTGDVSSSFEANRSQAQAPTSNTHTNTESLPPNPSPSFSFPARLHLEQLEVDFLRVNDLCAQTIKCDSLQTSQLEVNSMNAAGSLNISRIQTQTLTSDEVNCSRLSSDTVELSSVPPSSFYRLSSPEPLKPGSEQELCLKTEENEEKENESACPPEFPDSLHYLMGNVDSTNDLKSSHVAEKNLEKQLSVSNPSLEPESAQSISERKDASVGSQSTSSQKPLNVPVELNDLNQEPSREGESGVDNRQKDDAEENLQPEPIPDPVPQRPRRQSSHRTETTSEDKEQPEDGEQNVVVGSYTLPYSYMSPQTPTMNRNSSLRRSLRSSEARRSSPTPQSEPHVAFGHTSVAQGDVLSVKLSIPVEQGPIPPTRNTTGAGSNVSSSQRTSSSAQLPDSAASQAESRKNEAQQRQAKQTPLNNSAALPSVPVAGPSSQQSTQLEPQASDSDDDSFLNVSVRLCRAVLRFTMRTLQAMADYIDTASSEDPTKAEQQRANMQVLMCLLLVLVVGLILATARSGPYITPRWEFLMPPPDL